MQDRQIGRRRGECHRKPAERDNAFKGGSCDLFSMDKPGMTVATHPCQFHPEPAV